MKSDKYGERRGAAFGLAGVVNGFGISCLKKYGIVAVLREGLMDRYGYSLFLDILAYLLSLCHQHHAHTHPTPPKTTTKLSLSCD